jgi:hypothetical protein
MAATEASRGTATARRERVARQEEPPGSFLPGVLLESCQTIGIRSYAEHERLKDTVSWSLNS